jgi:O-acetyl-ADP-ribose deacetylase (regulator of RNase III)
VLLFDRVCVFKPLIKHFTNQEQGEKIMIENCKGNLLQANVEALVNPVNCVGVMGKGLALEFKKTYPDNFYHYQKGCNEGKIRPGQVFITLNNSLINPLYIINFPTKDHWKDKSKLEDIKTGLTALVRDINRLQIKSIAIPALGCGNGGLKWQKVEPLILSAFEKLSTVEVKLYLPFTK